MFKRFIVLLLIPCLLSDPCVIVRGQVLQYNKLTRFGRNVALQDLTPAVGSRIQEQAIIAPLLSLGFLIRYLAEGGRIHLSFSTLLAGCGVTIGMAALSKLGGPSKEEWDLARLFRDGEATEVPTNVDGTVLDSSHLTQVFNYIEHTLQHPQRTQVLDHLRTIFKTKQAYGFDEIRWEDDSYLLLFTSANSIDLANGFFAEGAFTVEEQALIVYFAGLESLAQKDPAYAPALLSESEPLHQLYGPHTALHRRLRAFATLTHPTDLSSALDRFNAFIDPKSPFHETIQLVEYALEHQDLLADGRIPILQQATYLARRLMQSQFAEGASGANDLERWCHSIVNRFQASNVTQLENIGRAGFTVLLPLFCYHRFLDDLQKKVNSEIQASAQAKSVRKNIEDLLILNPSDVPKIRRPNTLSSATDLLTVDISDVLKSFKPHALSSMVQSTPGPLSAMGMQAQQKRILKLLARAIHVLGRTTPILSPENPDEPIHIQGLGVVDLNLFSKTLTIWAHQTWQEFGLYYSAIENDVKNSFGIYALSDRQVEDYVTVDTIRGHLIHATLHIPRIDYTQILTYGPDHEGVRVVHFATMLAARLLIWHGLNSEEKVDSYDLLIGMIVQLRERLTKATLTPQPYAPNGKDFFKWTDDVLAHLATDIFSTCTMVLRLFGSMQIFLYGDTWQEGERKPVVTPDQTLAWYYALATDPKGLFATYAEHLAYETSDPKRLQSESARKLCDLLIALYEGGPHVPSQLQASMHIINEFRTFLDFDPEGISVRNPKAFHDFLTDDITQMPPDASDDDYREHYKEWKARRYPKGLETLTPELDVTTFPAPQLGRSWVTPDQQPSFFSPKPIPPELLLWPENTSVPSIGDQPKVLMYSGLYHEGGFPLPGVPCRFGLPNVQEGTPLVALVLKGKFQILPAVTTPNGKFKLPPASAASLVTLDLAEARQASYKKSGELWTRQPYLDTWPNVLPELTKDSAQPGYYQVSVSGDGLVYLPQPKGGLYLDASSLDTPTEALIVYVSAGGQQFLFRQEDQAYLGVVEAGQFVEDEHTLRAHDNLQTLKELPSCAAHNRVQTLADYRALETLAKTIHPALKEGIGYTTLTLTRSEKTIKKTEAITLQNNQVLVDRSLLSRPDRALGIFRRALSRQDPLVQLQAVSHQLDKIGNNDWNRLFDPTLKIPRTPKEILLAKQNHWISEAKERYRQLYPKTQDLESRLRRIQTISRYRHQFENTPPKVLHELLMKLLQEDKGAPFYFIDKKGSDTDFNRIRSYTQPGVGFITEGDFQSESDGELVLAERKALQSERQGRRFIFVRYKNASGKMVLLLFDENTGALCDEAQKKMDTVKRKLLRMISLPDEARASFQTQLEDLLRHFNSQQQKTMLESLYVLFPTFLRTVEHETHIAPEVREQMKRGAIDLVMGYLKSLATSEGLSYALNEAANLTQLPNGRVTYFLRDLLLTMIDLDLDPDVAEDVKTFVENVLSPLIEVRSNAKLEQLPLLSHSSFVEKFKLILARTHNRLVILQALTIFISPTQWIGLVAQWFGLTNDPDASPTKLHEFMLRRLKPPAASDQEDEADEIILKRMTKMERDTRASHLTILGGGNEIGASCLEWRYKMTRLLIDAGIRPGLAPEEAFPAFELLHELPQAVLLTHAHMDHIGAVLFLHYYRFHEKVPFYATPGTKRLMHIALKAMVKRQANQTSEEGYVEKSETEIPFFTEQDVEQFMNHVYTVKMGQDYSISPEVKIRFHRAGHVRGAASIVLMTPDGNTLVSGDISKRRQLPDKDGFQDIPPDLPIHTAYLDTSIPLEDKTDYNAERVRLFQALDKVLRKDKGQVLIPLDAIGPTQLILSLLKKADPEGRLLRVVIDGLTTEEMTRDYATHVPGFAASHWEYVSEEARKKGVSDWTYRKSVVEDPQRPTVILASSGDASVGLANWYARMLIGGSKNGIFFIKNLRRSSVGFRLVNAVKQKQMTLDMDRGGARLVVLLKNSDIFPLHTHAMADEVLDIVYSMRPHLQRVIFVHPGRKEYVDEVLLKDSSLHPVIGHTGSHIRSWVADNQDWFQDRFGMDGKKGGLPQLVVYKETAGKTLRTSKVQKRNQKFVSSIWEIAVMATGLSGLLSWLVTGQTWDHRIVGGVIRLVAGLYLLSPLYALGRKHPSRGWALLSVLRVALIGGEIASSETSEDHYSGKTVGAALRQHETTHKDEAATEWQATLAETRTGWLAAILAVVTYLPNQSVSLFWAWIYPNRTRWGPLDVHTKDLLHAA